MPFISDGCSGGVSWFLRAWGVPPCRFESCCVEHDRAYYHGGTRADRLQADKALLECWIDKGVPPKTARLGYWAIRIFGGPYFPAPWSWRFGKPWYRRCYDRR